MPVRLGSRGLALSLGSESGEAILHLALGRRPPGGPTIKTSLVSLSTVLRGIECVVRDGPHECAIQRRGDVVELCWTGPSGLQVVLRVDASDYQAALEAVSQESKAA